MVGLAGMLWEVKAVTLLGTCKARERVGSGEERISVLSYSVCNNGNNIRYDRRVIYMTLILCSKGEKKIWKLMILSSKCLGGDVIIGQVVAGIASIGEDGLDRCSLSLPSSQSPTQLGDLWVSYFCPLKPAVGAA